MAWRVFFECAPALPDILDAEPQAAGGLSFRWCDVPVQLEEAGESVPVGELANRILASEGGLTRVIDRTEDAGLVRRERPPGDRRVVLVHPNEQGLEALQASRAVHRDDPPALRRAPRRGGHRPPPGVMGKVRDHVRPLRPGRVSG